MKHHPFPFFVPIRAVAVCAIGALTVLPASFRAVYAEASPLPDRSGPAAGPGSSSLVEAARVQTKIVEAVSPSIVRVEYTLRYDGTDAPVSRGWNRRCPSCGRYHGDRVEPMVKEERPLERAGFSISPTEIVTGHLLVHPRFIERIAVAFGEQTVEAKPSSYAVDAHAMVLELAEPLTGVRPLEFGAGLDESLFFVTLQESRGAWTTVVHPFGGQLLGREDGSLFWNGQTESVVVNSDGLAAGIAMREELPLDGSWAGVPSDWTAVGAGEFEERMDRHAGEVSRRFPRVTLHFRSPREEPGQDQYSYHGYSPYGDDDDSATEREAVGVMLEDGRVLVLAALPPSVTARLERIRVHLPDRDAAVTAEFVASLTDYGALVAELNEPAESVGFSELPLATVQGRLLLSSVLEVRGEQLRVFHEPARIADLQKGRRGTLLPDLAGDADIFLFDLEGHLVALPIEVRDRTVGEERRWRSPDEILAPVSLIAEAVNNLEAHSDPANVPVDPEEEGRLAWVGVEIQPLDAGLARDLRVAGETNDGESGVLVTHVYSDSPAAEAGIEPGDVLLRVFADGLPRPYAVRLSGEGRYEQPFPWEQLDQIPDEYYSYLPPPWTSVANSFNRFLTNLGFDREVGIESMRDGELRRINLVVRRGPAHYEAAPQHRSDDYGLTVRELTFETRRFFQKEEDSPGLIIARIEPGSGASSGGLKPFEMITHINGDPVRSVDQFRDAADGSDELRLSVQRMHHGRIAVIRRSPGQ